MLNNLIYILVFTPIFAAMAIQLFGSNKIIAQSIAFSSLLLMLAMSIMITAGSFELSHIESNLSFDIVSLPIEFRTDLVLSTLVTILIIAKIFQLILFQGDFAREHNARILKSYFFNHFISCFAAIGIVISNNLFNLFIFIELYFFSYFALLLLQKRQKTAAQSSKQLIMSCFASMLFLLALTVLYFNFETLNLAKLVSKIDPSNKWLVSLACTLITLSLLTKFMPLWVFFSKNIKDPVAISGELFWLLFVNLNLLIALLIKAYYVAFNSNLSILIIIFICLAVILYCSVMMMFHKHLRSQITCFCLNLFCLTVISLALKNQSSFMASFFYIISHNSIALLIFFFISFIWNKYNVTTIDEISILKKSDSLLSRSSHNLFLVFMFLSIPLSFSPIFYANFFLFDAILDNNDDQLYESSNFFDPYILIAILLFHISSLVMFFKIIINMIYPNKPLEKSKKLPFLEFAGLFLVNFFALFLLFCAIVSAQIIQETFIEKFSKNLFNFL